MYTKPEPKKGYNVYVEHSIPDGEAAKTLTTLLREILTKTGEEHNPKIIPYCVEGKTGDEHEQYLHDFIKENADVHVYVMVPGTNVFEMIFDITESTKTAKKVFVLMLNQAAMSRVQPVGKWTKDEEVALMVLRQKMVKSDSKIVVVTDFTKLESSVAFTIHSGVNDPVYRNAQDALDEAAEKIKRGFEIRDNS